MSKKLLIFYICFITVLVLSYMFLPNYNYVHGKRCLDNGNTACAVQKLKQAYLLRPSNFDYEYYYAKALVKSKPNYDIQRSLYDLSKNAKSDSAKSLAISTVKKWKSNVITSIGRNYIEQTPSDTNIIHWNIDSFPLKVYVHADKNVPDYYIRTIKRALATWANAVDFISFTNTNNKNDAQIAIIITETPKDVCSGQNCKYVVGYTTPAIGGTILKKMTITLYNTNPQGIYFSEKEIYNTVMHELGHALGIMGHSYSSDDLMYSTQNNNETIYSKFNNDFQTLSGKDINTMKLLYKLEPDITDKINDKKKVLFTPVILGDKETIIRLKLEEAEDYIKDSPNIANGYINLAGVYLEMGKYDEANKQLLTALKLTTNNNELYMIYFNLALVNYKARKFSQAEEYIEKAKSFSNNSELAELEYLIKNRKMVGF